MSNPNILTPVELDTKAVKEDGTFSGYAANRDRWTAATDLREMDIEPGGGP